MNKLEKEINRIVMTGTRTDYEALTKDVAVKFAEWQNNEAYVLEFSEQRTISRADLSITS